MKYKTSLTLKKSNDVIHHINRIKRKKHVITSRDIEKEAWDKFQDMFSIIELSANWKWKGTS